jgi:hypothetical protein
VPQPTSLPACASWSTSTSRTPSGFAWCSGLQAMRSDTTCRRTGSRYEAIPPAEAHRILRRLEFHFTPKHASWLDMAEIEIGVQRGQCLDRRIDDRPHLEREIAAWQCERNAAGARIQWMFTTEGPAPKWAEPIAKPTRPISPPNRHNLCAAELG